VAVLSHVAGGSLSGIADGLPLLFAVWHRQFQAALLQPLQRSQNRLGQTSQSQGIPLRKAQPQGKQREFCTRFSIDLIRNDKPQPKLINHGLLTEIHAF
jgi:hypothetical protein